MKKVLCGIEVNDRGIVEVWGEYGNRMRDIRASSDRCTIYGSDNFMIESLIHEGIRIVQLVLAFVKAMV